ncbi:MAG: hypothetical protein ISS29_02660 [Candidatus Marinimicrobia bacterium]|nr:hypothetical protein [Candidatus Neomarinimicrobiota bacterium]
MLITLNTSGVLSLGTLIIHPARLLVGQTRLNDTVGQATAGCYSHSIPPGLSDLLPFL